MEDLKMMDVVDFHIFEQLQDSFTKLIGIPISVYDLEKNQLSFFGGLTDYSAVILKGRTELGIPQEKSEEWSKKDISQETVFIENNGLHIVVIPAVIHDSVVGYMVGGPVRTTEIQRDMVSELQKTLGYPLEEAQSKVEQLTMLTEEKLHFVADYIKIESRILFDLAYNRYQVMIANIDIEKAANMKTDFLANMSHEIRTPMNAVIGMAEMALREELPAAARNYITQIKSSGRALLNLINDILDFSKIDSGKMELQSEEYEPLSLFNDVANILMTRLKDKLAVELQLEIAPDFPNKLYGDSLRVRQVLINLANNAVKFTNRGRVLIQVGYDRLDEEHIQVNVSIKDTGIGIKKEDLNKLFQSFQQVNSKRNRNIEGTGLGLAISKQLVELMGGSIRVESEYEKGSTFSFSVPQQVMDWSPTLLVKHAESIAAVGYFQNPLLAKQFQTDTNRLGVFSVQLQSPEQLDELLDTYRNELVGKMVYLFFEEESYVNGIEKIMTQYPDLNVVSLIDFFAEQKETEKNLRVMRRPLSTIGITMALNDEDYVLGQSAESVEFDFTAPDAEILIVDDNSVNLTVAEGLLEPLKMKVYSATSGKMALEMINHYHFDLIFMDHMMPEIDGVETTRIIRRLHPEYDDVPVIALTANAIEGSKDMFLKEGMNDFVAKPIEVRMLVNKVRQWLPPAKIIKGSKLDKLTQVIDTRKAQENILIGDLDTFTARKMLGSDKLFWSVLKEYYRTIPTKHDCIQQYYDAEDWEAYTIEVHALKSASKQIGAMELSAIAADMEAAGHENNIERIRVGTEALLKKLLSYVNILAPYVEEQAPVEEESKGKADYSVLSELLDQIYEASENLDMDCMEETMEKISKFEYMGMEKDLLVNMREAVENIDVDSLAVIVENWRVLIEENQ